MDQILTATAVIVSLAVLTSAAVSDWRCREVSDIHWAILICLGIVLFTIRLYEEGSGPAAYLMPVSMALMGIDCIYDRGPSVVMDCILYVLIAATSVVPFMMIGGETAAIYASIPVTYVCMNVLYMLGIVSGGADAKAIIAISMVFPVYPVMFGLPLIPIPGTAAARLFTPAFTVFVLALLLSLLCPILCAVRNTVRGRFVIPQMFMGTLMDIDKAKKSFVWPLEHVSDGKVVLGRSAVVKEGALEELESMGRKEVWVTPMIPFVVPIAAAFLITSVVGSPFFIL
ncbi:MAG: A24 family peptidase C-terminal domain-containing protein [Candidatus Methanomethylophilaceae archaeon]